MAEVLFRGKSWVYVPELIDALKPENTLRVIFDNTLKTKYGKTWVRVLAVKGIKDGVIVKDYDMLDIFDIKGINVWLCCGKQLRNVKFSTTELSLHCVEIDLTPIPWMDHEGTKRYYHKLTYRPVIMSDKNKRKMSEYITNLEKKETEHVNKRAKIANDKMGDEEDALDGLDALDDMI